MAMRRLGIFIPERLALAIEIYAENNDQKVSEVIRNTLKDKFGEKSIDHQKP